MLSRGDSLATFVDPALIAAEKYIREMGEEFDRIRRESLYTWMDEEWARFSLRLTSEKTKFFYELEIEEPAITHKGDLHFYTKVSNELAISGNPSRFRENYWNSDEREGGNWDQVEILVPNARVLGRLDPPPH